MHTRNRSLNDVTKGAEHVMVLRKFICLYSNIKIEKFNRFYRCSRNVILTVLINKCLSDNNTNSNFLFTKSLILFKQEKFEEAKNIVLLAITNSGVENYELCCPSSRDTNTAGSR